MRILTASAALIIVSANSMAAPVVSGTTISWPEGDEWYQVQTTDTYESICNGGTSCDVAPGFYNVINHTTGERFDGVKVGEPGTGDSGITVTANTIAWPDNGDWYQVQRYSDYETICNGGTSCDVESGIYVVINHSSGERFNNINVSDAPPPATTVSVSGNVISYPDDDWYQVLDTQDNTPICNGEKLCVVPDGEYVVINQTTGERFEPVFVNTEIPVTDMPLINADNWQELLRNAISVINGDLVNERNGYLLQRLNTIAGVTTGYRFLSSEQDQLQDQFVVPGLTRVAVEPGLTPVDDFLGLTRVINVPGLTLFANTLGNGAQYSCIDGGTYSFNDFAGSIGFSGAADDCAIDGNFFDGSFSYNFMGSGRDIAWIPKMDVVFSDGATLSLNGRYTKNFSHPDSSVRETLTEVNYSEESPTGSYYLENLALEKISINGYDHRSEPVSLSLPSQSEPVDVSRYLYNASVEGAFVAFADWTGYVPMAVAIDMNFDSSVLAVSKTISDLDAPYTTTSNEVVWPVDMLPGALPSHWTQGSLTISAADGSTVTMTPDPTNEQGAIVTLSALDDRQQVLLSDGYQVFCYESDDEFYGRGCEVAGAR